MESLQAKETQLAERLQVLQKEAAGGLCDLSDLISLKASQNARVQPVGQRPAGSTAKTSIHPIRDAFGVQQNLTLQTMFVLCASE